MNVSPSILNRTPVTTQTETKEQAQPMSTAVVLQRYWRLSASCQTYDDNEAFSYNGDFSYHLVRYPHIIHDLSALDNMRYDALFGMGSNRFGTMAVDYTSSSTSRSGCLNIEIVICLSEFIRSGYTGLHTHANTAVAMRRLRRSERWRQALIEGTISYSIDESTRIKLLFHSVSVRWSRDWPLCMSCGSPHLKWLFSVIEIVVLI